MQRCAAVSLSGEQHDDLVVSQLSLEQLRAVQMSDSVLSQLLAWLSARAWPDYATIVDSSPELKALYSQWACYTAVGSAQADRGTFCSYWCYSG